MMLQSKSKKVNILGELIIELWKYYKIAEFYEGKGLHVWRNKIECFCLSRKKKEDVLKDHWMD